MIRGSLLRICVVAFLAAGPGSRLVAGDGLTGQNLARGAVGWQASSSFNGAFGGDKTYDGIVSTASKWTSNGTTGGSWLALDLGASFDITGFVVQHAGASGEPSYYNTQSYRLEAGPGFSGPWSVLASVDNSSQQNSTTTSLATAVAARYVRLYVADAGVDNYARIPEFQVFGVPGVVNLARNAVGWSASSIFNASYGGEKAYDGGVSATSKWTSNGAGSQSWLALDLGAAHQLTRFVVRHAGAAGELTHFNTQSCRIESGTSLSGPWTVVANVDNTAQQHVTTTVLASAVTARYVRLYILDAGIDNYARIPEFEVYGSQAGPQIAYVKVGFHAGVGGNRAGIGDYFARLDAAGVPFTIKSVDDVGLVVEAAQYARQSGVKHNIILRFTRPGGVIHDLPNFDLPPEQAAQEHWGRVRGSIPPEFEPYKDLIWIEPTNEIDTHTKADWLGWFCYYIGRLGMADGYKIALAGFNAGQPEPEHWELEGFRLFLQDCAANPERLAISLHEGKLGDMNAHPATFYPHLIGRFTWLYEVVDQMGIARPTTFISEWAWSYNDMPGVSQAMEDVEWLSELIAPYSTLRGVFLWNLAGGGQWSTLPNKLQKLIVPITDYAVATRFEVVPK